MNRIQYFFLSLVVFFSTQAYSGMEQTEKCNKQIETLQSKISSIEKEIKDSNQAPLIPDSLRKKKIRDLENEKGKIQTIY